jgi:hypothetical protein
MTAQPTQPPSLSLDPATFAVLLRTICNAMPRLPNETQADKAEVSASVLDALTALGPRDPVEAMLAAQFLVAHHASMHASYWAARTDLPPPLLLRFKARADSHARLSQSTLREFNRRKAGPAQKPAQQPAQPSASTPASAPAPCAQQAPTVRTTQARPVTQTARPEMPAPAQRPATAPGVQPSPTETLHAQLLADLAARAMTSTTALAA